MKISGLGRIKWEGHSLPIFPGVDCKYMGDWNHDLSWNTTKSRLEAYPIVFYCQLMARLQGKIQNDLIVLHKFHGHFYPSIHKNCHKGRKTKIRAPLM